MADTTINIPRESTMQSILTELQNENDLLKVLTQNLLVATSDQVQAMLDALEE